jgi:hypothetical protein
LKFFIFSIDTEPDCPDWTGFDKNQLEFKNFDSLERLWGLANKYKIPVTFYVTWSSASNEKALEWLFKFKKDLNCEIAAHLHPSDTPPFSTIETDNILKLKSDELESKFDSLHMKISEIYGKPKSFRGAAWTIDNRTVTLLEKYGYTSDSSVSPGVSWKIKARQDWSKSPEKPYILDRLSPGKRGVSNLLEIPVSIHSIVPPLLRITGNTGSLMSMPLSSRESFVFQIIKRLSIRPKWIRPAFTRWEVMKKVIDSCSLKTGLAHAMAHSSEFVPGASPYNMNKWSHNKIWERLELLFSYIRSNDFVPVTVSEYKEYFQKSVMQ